MKRTIYLFGLLACMASCADEQPFDAEQQTDSEIRVGEKVEFATNVPRVGLTRAVGVDNILLKQYKCINDDYQLTLTMWEEGESDHVGQCNYVPETVGVNSDQSAIYDEEGTLKVDKQQGQKELVWHSNVKKYAFEATAGSEEVSNDQSTATLMLAQDRLHGYAFSPVLHEEGIGNDVIGKPNYHTSREWYQLNKQWHDAEGLMMPQSDYKKVPLFLQHERAWITIILRAGKGVNRESVLAHIDSENPEVFNPNVVGHIYSYKSQVGSDPVVTDVDHPLVGESLVEYSENDKARNLRYDAIVEPYDYTKNPKDDKIAAISVSKLNFSFYASNDQYFNKPEGSSEHNAYKEMYNLTAGKHLVIEATLTSERIVFITAIIEDWTDRIVSTICDDYGQNGEPEVIVSREQLLSFLQSNRNKAGNVAIISAQELDLDKKVTPGATSADAPKIEDDPWTRYNTLELHASLNMAGATFRTSGRLFETIKSTGNLINGTIVMTNNSESPVDAAIAEKNEGGTIERISVSVGNKQAYATKAGMVVENNGSIQNCHSYLPVVGRDGTDYVGGIAAISKSAVEGVVPTIDGCTVSARVKCDKAALSVKGGGIVGQAEGRVTNNTFDYGITLLQDPERFKNIVAATVGTADLTSKYNNQWPTIADNEMIGASKFTIVNASDAKYDNVLDCQEELAELLTTKYNKRPDGTRVYKYRISDSFTVEASNEAASWRYGKDIEIDPKSQDPHSDGNLYCELDGNNKTITLTGTREVSIPIAFTGQTPSASKTLETAPMLFSNITGSVHDLNISVKKPVIATPSQNDEGKYDAIDAIAPLAYAVSGSNASVRNVTVIMDASTYVQATSPAGLVCWVNNGATVENCRVKGDVVTWVPDNNNVSEDQTTEATRLAGGIVAMACTGMIKDCLYVPLSKNTLQKAAASGNMTIYYGGILGGTATVDGDDAPRISIIDCTSEFVYEDNTNSRYGSILGRSTYVSGNVTMTGTATEDPNKCQGNWWTGRGVGAYEMSIETVIGKRNAVKPTSGENF